MRDDFQVPNMGQAPASYETSYFNRMVRNIEMTFTTLRAKGTIAATVITYQPATVAALNLVLGVPGMTAYASNGRKNGEGVGAGTGVLVFHDGTAWRACDTGQTVSA